MREVLTENPRFAVSQNKPGVQIYGFYKVLCLILLGSALTQLILCTIALL